MLLPPLRMDAFNVRKSFSVVAAPPPHAIIDVRLATPFLDPPQYLQGACIIRDLARWRRQVPTANERRPIIQTSFGRPVRSWLSLNADALV